MEFKELKTKTEKDLMTLLAKQKEDLRALRFRIHSSQVKDVSQPKKIKKTISQILTLLTKKKV